MCFPVVQHPAALLLGSFSCAVVVAGSLPPWRQLSGPIALGATVGFRIAMVHSPAWCFAVQGLLRSSAGHVKAGQVKKVPTRTGPRCAPSACYPC